MYQRILVPIDRSATSTKDLDEAIQLIVIGTHGRRGVDRLFLGSDAEQIVRTAPVPVLLVRAPLEKRDATP
jgi:nucleotide-binding universal stress UspA family protein